MFLTSFHYSVKHFVFWYYCLIHSDSQKGSQWVCVFTACLSFPEERYLSTKIVARITWTIMWQTNLFTLRSSLASCQAAYRVQAVHDCTSLSARQSTTLSGRPHHAVCRSDRQSRPQIRHVWLCRSATYHVIARWPLVRCGRSARVEQSAVTTSLCRVDSVNTFKRQLKTFRFAQAFQLFGFFSFYFQLHTVRPRRPCYVLQLRRSNLDFFELIWFNRSALMAVLLATHTVCFCRDYTTLSTLLCV